MRLLIDGDGTPDIALIKECAMKYDVPMIVYVDYAHHMADDYYQVIYCEVSHDSVDMQIINDVQKGDLVITQDYGLASMILAKDAYVLHPSGRTIDALNIDQCLTTRFILAKQRKGRHHLKGPKKKKKS